MCTITGQHNLTSSQFDNRPKEKSRFHCIWCTETWIALLKVTVTVQWPLKGDSGVFFKAWDLCWHISVTHTKSFEIDPVHYLSLQLRHSSRGCDISLWGDFDRHRNVHQSACFCHRQAEVVGCLTSLWNNENITKTILTKKGLFVRHL